MTKDIRLTNPETFRIADEIREPDRYIDEIAAAFADDEESVARFKTIKALSHEEKVHWLLSLPDHDSSKGEPVGCAGVILVIIVYFCVMAIIGYEAATGKPIKEKKCTPKEVKKCVPKKP
jgi:hypothetical protein